MSDLFDDLDAAASRPSEHDAEAFIRSALDLVQTAKAMPLSASVLVSREELVELLQAALDRMPDELREARWLLKEREEFLAERSREADALLEEVRVQAERMVQRTEIVRQANHVAQRILDDANEEARRLRHEAEDYADQKLASFEIVLDRTMKTVQAGRREAPGDSLAAGGDRRPGGHDASGAPPRARPRAPTSRRASSTRISPDRGRVTAPDPAGLARPIAAVRRDVRHVRATRAKRPFRGAGGGAPRESSGTADASRARPGRSRVSARCRSSVPEGAPVTVRRRPLLVSRAGSWPPGRWRRPGAGECRRCGGRWSRAGWSPRCASASSRRAAPRATRRPIPFSGDELDLEPMARDAVLLELPLAPLCSEECLGPLPECGTNWNLSPATVPRPVDPRWSALDALRERGAGARDLGCPSLWPSPRRRPPSRRAAAAARPTGC